MKRYFLILFVLLLLGCGRQPVDFSKGAIITDVILNGEGCVYYTETIVFYNGNTLRSKAIFSDVCGKYTVGDTVITIKK